MPDEQKQPEAPAKPRVWFQFSLSMLLLVVGLGNVFYFWHVNEMKTQAERHQVEVDRLKKEADEAATEARSRAALAEKAESVAMTLTQNALDEKNAALKREQKLISTVSTLKKKLAGVDEINRKLLSVRRENDRLRALLKKHDIDSTAP